MFNKDDDIIKPPITFPKQNTPSEVAQPAESTMPTKPTAPVEPAAEPAQTETTPSDPGRMPIDDVFTIRGRGKVAVGTIESGSFKVGQNITVKTAEGDFSSTIKGIEVFMKHLDEAKAGDRVGMLIDVPDGQDVSTDDLILG